MTEFDNNGQVLKQVVNALSYKNKSAYSQLSHFKVVQASNHFIFHVKMLNSFWTTAICGQLISESAAVSNILFKVDRNFNCVKYKVNFCDQLLFMAANSVNILCVDNNYKYYFLDADLEAIPDKPSIYTMAQVSNSLVAVQINEQFMFFLGKFKKLKIFSIESGLLVKEIETNANQIKLVSTDYLVLFDSEKRVVYFYEQNGEFRKLDEVDLAQSIDTNLVVSRDRSSILSFYNSKLMKYVSLD
jgi:hypothetical protein